MVEEKLELKKMRERLNWAIETLKNIFGDVNKEVLMHESCEIAKTLFVRSEIAYSGKR